MRWAIGSAALVAAGNALAAGGASRTIDIAGIPLDFILFALILIGVALFHNKTLQVAAYGLAAVVLYKVLFTDFRGVPGLTGLGVHLAHEWVILTNLFLLLVGFAILARHFEKSRIPAVLPKYLPDDWKGGFAMLLIVFVLSSFLDNIAAAMIGGAMAHTLFRAKVHIGYLAAIVAASNAGGAGSVVGDTTTTMMWIDKVAAIDVFHAYVAAVVAVVVCGVPASMQQQKYSPILKGAHAHTHIDWVRVAIVAAILVGALVVNITMNSNHPDLADRFPFLGATVWVVILASVSLRRPDWEILPETAKGSVFLLCLVMTASLMPVDRLPGASWQTALGLGFLSSVFDNIPLTALALRQDGYDWGFLAYAVGFGGSMIWFGSSAGVALSNMYPEAKSVGRWLASGWHVTVAYVIGFFVMLAVLGWHPTPKGGQAKPAAPASTSTSPGAK